MQFLDQVARSFPSGRVAHTRYLEMEEEMLPRSASYGRSGSVSEYLKPQVIQV